jgi:hypothetical protein
LFGGQRSGASRGARADLAARTCGSWSGEERPHRGEHAHSERSGAEQRGGITPPAGQRPKGAKGRGAGGRGQGAGLRAGQKKAPTTRPRAQRTIKKRRPEETRARARAARIRQTSGTVSERRGARRPGASATPQNAPSLLREELARGDAQRTHDSQGRSVAEAAAGDVRKAGA